MNNTGSISDYKAKAKENLLGNYGIAIASFVILFVLVYSLTSILMGAYAAVFKPGIAANGPGFAVNFLKTYVPSSILGLVVNIFTDIFMVGYIYILRDISYGRSTNVSKLFFAFKNHPDTIIIISAVLGISQLLLTLPGEILGSYGMNNLDGTGAANGKYFFAWIVVFVVGVIAYMFVFLSLAVSYMVYLDSPELSALECMKKSHELMKGNRFRYFYVYLSLIGYWLLGMLGAVVGCLWVYAYQNMIFIEFYKDIAGERNED